MGRICGRFHGLLFLQAWRFSDYRPRASNFGKVLPFIGLAFFLLGQLYGWREQIWAGVVLKYLWLALARV